LGIALKRNQPAHPEQNGRHERIHRDIKAETTRPPAHDLRRQQQRFKAFLREHNQDRPHEALGQEFPSEHYRPSPRPYPERLPPSEYPSHFEVRRVNNNGCIKLWGEWVFLSHALIQEQVGLIEEDDQLWAVYLGNLRLALLDRRSKKISQDPGPQQQKAS